MLEANLMARFLATEEFQRAEAEAAEAEGSGDPASGLWP